MIPNENVLVTALQVAAFHKGGLYTLFPNEGPLKYTLHVPGYVLNKAPTLDEAVGHFKALVSDMGYTAPPTLSVDDVFGDKPSGTKIQALNKTIGSIIGTETFSPQFLYNENSELVRETVESFYPGLEIGEPALQNIGMQVIRLDVNMNEEPEFENINGLRGSHEYRTIKEINKSHMSPAVEYLVAKKEHLFK